ncbi:MAG: hypothetical protein ACRENK_09000 [Gemmatimonadaceae bacterium]
MASLSALNEMLVKAAADIDVAMRAIASEKQAFASTILDRLGTVQVEIFEAQYQLWALDPSLLPDVLKGPAEDPGKAFEVAMNRVRQALDNKTPDVAKGILDIFIAHQISPEYLERARKERARLSK